MIKPARLRKPSLIRAQIGASLFFVLLWAPFALNASECPIDREAEFEAGVWLQQLESLVEIPVPDGMRISSFGSTKDPITGQEYDEISFSAQAELSDYFFIVLQTIATYEKVPDFRWSDIADEGQPMSTGVCSLAEGDISYGEYEIEGEVIQRAIYANDTLLLKVYAADALSQLTRILVNVKRL